jgi:hypothetical protein
MGQMAGTEETSLKATLQRRAIELKRIGQLSAESRALNESRYDEPVLTRTASYTHYREGSPGVGDQA